MPDVLQREEDAVIIESKNKNQEKAVCLVLIFLSVMLGC